MWMNPSLNNVKNIINNAQVEVDTNANTNTNLIQEDNAQKTVTEVKTIEGNQDTDQDNQVNGTVNKTTDNLKEQTIVGNNSADSNSSANNSSPSKIKPVVSKTKPVPKSNFA